MFVRTHPYIDDSCDYFIVLNFILHMFVLIIYSINLFSYIDFIAIYKPFDKWTFMLNADYAHDEDAVSRGKDGYWSGIAGYVKYDIRPWMSLVNRTEYFSDPQGLRIVPGSAQNIWETTLTLELRPYKDLITRFEYRHDESSSEIFTRDQEGASHQDTIGLEVIYVF